MHVPPLDQCLGLTHWPSCYTSVYWWQLRLFQLVTSPLPCLSLICHSDAHFIPFFSFLAKKIMANGVLLPAGDGRPSNPHWSLFLSWLPESASGVAFSFIFPSVRGGLLVISLLLLCSYWLFSHVAGVPLLGLIRQCLCWIPLIIMCCHLAGNSYHPSAAAAAAAAAARADASITCCPLAGKPYPPYPSIPLPHLVCVLHTRLHLYSSACLSFSSYFLSALLTN